MEQPIQRVIHESSRTLFDQLLSEMLEKGYQVVPGSYCFNAVVIPPGETVEGYCRQRTLCDFFIIVEKV